MPAPRKLELRKYALRNHDVLNNGAAIPWLHDTLRRVADLCGSYTPYDTPARLLIDLHRTAIELSQCDYAITIGKPSVILNGGKLNHFVELSVIANVPLPGVVPGGEVLSVRLFDISLAVLTIELLGALELLSRLPANPADLGLTTQSYLNRETAAAVWRQRGWVLWHECQAAAYASMAGQPTSVLLGQWLVDQEVVRPRPAPGIAARLIAGETIPQLAEWRSTLLYGASRQRTKANQERMLFNEALAVDIENARTQRNPDPTLDELDAMSARFTALQAAINDRSLIDHTLDAINVATVPGAVPQLGALELNSAILADYRDTTPPDPLAHAARVAAAAARIDARARHETGE